MPLIRRSTTRGKEPTELGHGLSRFLQAEAYGTSIRKLLNKPTTQLTLRARSPKDLKI